MTTLRLPLHRPARTTHLPTPPPPDLRRLTSAEAALAAIEDWGVVLLFPARDVPVPSLWELWRGQRGPLASMAWDEIADVWRWKDEIAGRRLALFSHWLGGRHAFLARQLVPALRAQLATWPPAPVDAELAADAARIAGALRERGPLPAAALRRRAGLAAKSATERFNAALEYLEGRLEVATVGDAADPAPVANLHAPVESAFADLLADLPSAAVAERELAGCLEHLSRWSGAAPAAIARCLGWERASTAEPTS